MDPWTRSGELYPCETDERLCDQLETGADVEVDLEADRLTDLATGRTFGLKPLGEVRNHPTGLHCSATAPFASVALHMSLINAAKT